MFPLCTLMTLSFDDTCSFTMYTNSSCRIFLTNFAGTERRPSVSRKVWYSSSFPHQAPLEGLDVPPAPPLPCHPVLSPPAHSMPLCPPGITGRPRLSTTEGSGSFPITAPARPYGKHATALFNAVNLSLAIWWTAHTPHGFSPPLHSLACAPPNLSHIPRPGRDSSCSVG